MKVTKLLFLLLISFTLLGCVDDEIKVQGKILEICSKSWYLPWIKVKLDSGKIEIFRISEKKLEKDWVIPYAMKTNGKVSFTYVDNFIDYEIKDNSSIELINNN